MFLAHNLKFLREQMGICQDEMAKKLDVTQSAVGNWEKNHRKPDIEMIVRLAEYFGVSIDDLVLRDLKPPAAVYVINLRFLRMKHGMTQTDMANLLGYRGKQGYSAIETGKVKANVDDLEKMADFFGITLDQLVKQDLSKETNAYDKGSKGKRIEALDYALNCIVNREDRTNHFSVLQDMFMELQEELYGSFSDSAGSDFGCV